MHEVLRRQYAYIAWQASTRFRLPTFDRHALPRPFTGARLDCGFLPPFAPRSDATWLLEQMAVSRGVRLFRVDKPGPFQGILPA